MKFLLRKHGFNIVSYHEGSPNLFVCAEKADITDCHPISSSLDKFAGLNLKDQFDDVKEKIKYIFEQHDQVILFGASIICTTVVSFLTSFQRKKIKCIMDNDKSKHGRFIFGCDRPITAVKKPDANEGSPVIVLTWIFFEEINNQLLDLGYSNSHIINIESLMEEGVRVEYE